MNKQRQEDIEIICDVLNFPKKFTQQLIESGYPSKKLFTILSKHIIAKEP
jgi:hypothetical protein